MNENLNTDSSPENTEALASLEAVRDRLVNYILIAAAIGGLPTILAGLPRSLEFGFKPVQYFVHAAYVVVVLLAVFRRRTPYPVKAYFTILLAFGGGMFSLESWGLIGMYSVYLMVAIFLAVILLGIRGGIVVSVFAIVCEVAIMLLVSWGVIEYDFNFHQFTLAPSSWIMSLGHIALFSILMILCFGYIQRSQSDDRDP